MLNKPLIEIAVGNYMISSFILNGGKFKELSVKNFYTENSERGFL